MLKTFYYVIEIPVATVNGVIISKVANLGPFNKKEKAIHKHTEQ